MKSFFKFCEWFWETFLGDDMHGIFIGWTFAVLVIFLIAFGYFFGWMVIAYFFGGVLGLAALVVVGGYILLFRNAYLDYQARLFDKLRGGPAKE